MVHPTLLVLAAGMGSRYGGLKQMDPVGPHGEFLIDYSVYDAIAAGFRKIVFVIRREMDEPFRATITSRIPRGIEVQHVYQELDVLPPGFTVPETRKKPWGTGHAIWVAREHVHEPFLVINADDFYGAAAYQAAARHIQAQTAPGDGSFMVGYRLRNTVSPHGPVSRGLCQADTDGWLTNVTEVIGITVDPLGTISAPEPNGTRRQYTGEEVVSMNMWGFEPSLFGHLDRLLGEFLAAKRDSTSAEFYIPEAVASLIRQGLGRVKLLTAGQAQWIGVTYAQDKPIVAERIRGLIAEGVYSSPLWRSV